MVTLVRNGYVSSLILWRFVRFGTIRNLKNMKNTYEGGVLLVKLHASA